MRKESDIKESWVEKDEEAKNIIEGDLVALHNWGMSNGIQIIGIAVVIWNEEYHKWDFSMVAGNYIEDEYDRWRQCPKIIGRVKHDNCIHSNDRYEYTTMEITDEDFKKWDCKWNELIEYERLEADKRWHIKRKKDLMKNLNNKKKELEEEMAKIKIEEDKINEEIKKIKNQSLSGEIMTLEQAEKVEEILEKVDVYTYKFEQENIKYINEEYEDDGTLHITRKGWRFCFSNGQDEDCLKTKDIPEFVKLVEKAIKECGFDD